MSTPQPEQDVVELRRQLFDKAVSNGDLAVIRSLARVLPEKGREGLSADSLGQALHLAVLAGDVETVDALLRGGADANHTDISGQAPAFWAVENIQPAILRMLVEHGATFEGRRGADVMMRAVLRGNPEAVEILIGAGAPAAGVKNTQGTNLLHFACQLDYVEIAQQLLKAGIPVGSINPNGLTPLHFTGESATAAAAELLLSHGADINGRSKSGLTPVLAAAMRGQPQGFTKLVALGGDPLARTESNSGAFELAMAYVRDDMAAWLLEHYPMVRPTGAALDEAFVNAVRKGCAGVVKKLAELGADIGQKPDGRSLLQCAPAKAVEVKRVLRALKTGETIASAMNAESDKNAPTASTSPTL